MDFTYVSPRAASVIDYILAWPEYFSHFKHLKVGDGKL